MKDLNETLKLEWKKDKNNVYSAFGIDDIKYHTYQGYGGSLYLTNKVSGTTWKHRGQWIIYIGIVKQTDIFIGYAKTKKEAKQLAENSIQIYTNNIKTNPDKYFITV